MTWFHARRALLVCVAGGVALTVACSSDPDPTSAADDAGVVEADASSPTADAGSDAPSYGPPRTEQVFDAIRISSIREDEYFQRATVPVDFGEGPFERVTLSVQLETTCFPFSEWSEPPEGHRWPADCDAYDRNFEFVLDPATEEGDEPGFELVRAITPFGGPMEFDVDVTDLANARPGAHEIQVRITTWSDASGQVSGSAGGWNVTADLELVPGPPPRDVVSAVSVFNGNLRFDSAVGSFDVDVPDEASTARVDYRVTGHGGVQTGDNDCIGGAEEFCQRTHYMTALGVPQPSMVPWRDDCQELCTLTSAGTNFQYCAENPTGSVQSVRAPRANWCPGDVTPPFSWEIERLAGGTRPLEFSVEGMAEGGSWRTSATVFFYR